MANDSVGRGWSRKACNHVPGLSRFHGLGHVPLIIDHGDRQSVKLRWAPLVDTRLVRCARGCSDREAACHMRLCASCKRSSLFMLHRNPLDIVALTDPIGHSVVGVPCYAADSFHPSREKCTNAYFRDRLLR